MFKLIQQVYQYIKHIKQKKLRKISFSPIIKLEKKGGNFAFENHMPLNVVNVK